MFGNAGARYRISFRDDDPGEPVAMLAFQPGDEALPADGSEGHVYSQLKLDRLATEDPVRAHVVAAPSEGGPAPAVEQQDSRSESQAVVLHVRTKAFRRRASRRSLDRLEDRLTEAVETSGVGEVDGVEYGPRDAVLFLYGPDSSALWAVVEPIVSASGAGVVEAVLRSGGPRAPEVRRVVTSV